jgi:LemA protein
MVWLWVLIGILAVVILYAIFTYNRLVRARVRVDNGWSQIDVQLRRRYDLIPNLIETVKGYASHERTVLEDVTNARAQAQSATGVQGQAAAENELTRSIRQLFAVAENYPELKASQNFLNLQEELTGTESRIAFARQFYNDQVANLNVLIGTFPPNIIARLGRFTPREFFEIDDPAKGPVQVSF